MPVQYTSIIEEHQAVRNNVGIFDISHMGQLLVTGPAAAEWLNTMLTNNIDKLEVGLGQYTFLLNERGGIIDDLIVYRIEGQMFLLVVNAARTDQDFAWLDRHRAKDVDLKDRSASFGGVAIQGPRMVELFRTLFGKDVDPPGRNHIVDLPFDGTSVSVARTGYTGEDGVEVFFRAEDAAKFWNAALEKGKAFGIRPCGLGARDTLRLEVCYPLNGSDLSPERNPIEAGLGFFVDLTKPNFIGREVVSKTKENALSGFRQQRTGRRGDERHTFSKLELRHRHGIRVRAAREDRNQNRHRDSRPKVSSHDREETALQKIMNVPDDLLYTESHEWIKREGDNVRIGITDHAQSELTDVVYVELPKMDRQANAKEAIAVVESVKAASDIYAPVKGTVVEINKALEADPGLINREPYGQGWIFVLKIDNADDLKQLKDAAAYKKQIG